MPEEIDAIDAAGALGPDSQVVSQGKEDKNGWWRTAIWVQRRLETKHGCILGMVLGFWVGKLIVQWAVLAMELPLAGEGLWSAGVSVWDAILSLAM